MGTKTIWDGEDLPPIGCEVLIHLARQDKWVRHKVLRYELEKAEAKAAAFDWLMARMQEAYDQGGWVDVGDVSIGAQMMWGRRDECSMKAEIQWKDRRDEPLDLLSAIKQAITEAGGGS